MFWTSRYGRHLDGCLHFLAGILSEMFDLAVGILTDGCDLTVGVRTDNDPPKKILRAPSRTSEDVVVDGQASRVRITYPKI